MKTEGHEQTDKVFKIFEGVVELEGESRNAFLDQACAGDPELRKEVEALLAYDERVKSFIESPAFEEAPELIADNEGSTRMIEAVGPFKIVSRLGSGGMGEVYLAEDSRLGRKVALKLLDRSLIADSQSRGRFVREARLASALDHSNICTIHEIGEASGLLFIAMQYVEGETLKKVIGDRPLSLDSLLSISLQVANGLAAAHAQGTIHRDIKSNNIIITPRGQAKVLDFGLARPKETEDGETELTRTGAVMGTPTYMSPEQARGERADHRSDIFSFGVVMYEMATGRTPFKAKSRAETMNAVINQLHTPVEELSKDAPPELSAVIDRALAKQPSDRYQSIEEMIRDLRQAAQAIGLVGSNSSDSMMVPYVPLPRPGRVTRWVETNVRRPAVVVGFAAILVGLVIYTLMPKVTVAPAGFKSIAVLPFKPLVAESRDESLEMGMADTLIALLSNIRQINARPISAVRKYAGLEQDPLAAGREQRVDAVLDGQIQKSGDKIRVTARLVRVKDGATLWSGQFDERATDIFSVQDSISERVAGVLAVKLTGDEQRQLTKRHTESTEAYQLYMVGRLHYGKRTKDATKKSIDYFNQAIERDPNYALAHAALAAAYSTSGWFGYLTPHDGYTKAREAATRALQIDDALSEAHGVLGNIKRNYDWDWSGAEAEYNRAIELDPNNATAHHSRGSSLAYAGRFDESILSLRRAQDLDPVSMIINTSVAGTFLLARRYDDAIEQYKKVLEMDPSFALAHSFLGEAYYHKNMHPEAVAELLKGETASGRSSEDIAALRTAYETSGMRGYWQKLIELKKRSSEGHTSPFDIAFLYSALGDRDHAFEWLERAYREHDPAIIVMKGDPMFDSLRSDPRFTELLRRVGLPQ